MSPVSLTLYFVKVQVIPFVCIFGGSPGIAERARGRRTGAMAAYQRDPAVITKAKELCSCAMTVTDKAAKGETGAITGDEPAIRSINHYVKRQRCRR